MEVPVPTVINMTGPVEGWFIGRFLEAATTRIWEAYYRYIRGEEPPEERVKKIEKRHEEEKERLWEEIEKWEEQVEERESQLEVKRSELSVKDRLMESLEYKGVSREELIRKYQDEIPVIIVNYGRHEPSGWLKETLQNKYNSIGLSGGGQIIPPEKVPIEVIDGRKSLEAWLEEDVYENKDEREAVIVYVSLVDLKDLVWRKDFESRTWTIGEVIPIENYLTDKEFYSMDEVTDSIQHIEKGDIGFLAGRYVSEEELQKIHRRQPQIEEKLGNPNIKEIAEGGIRSELMDALEGIVSDPEDVADGVIHEANLWKEEFFE